ncbi:hypothetical protein OA79_14995 [Marinomonas sp. TW1]|nr:hypothetical protein OA79_14995 [Marinomonas sp. TW1]
MTENELIQELYKIQDLWSEQPHLANDYSEGLRFNELRNELKSLHNITAEFEFNSTENKYVLVLK